MLFRSAGGRDTVVIIGMQGEPVMAEADVRLHQPEARRAFSRGSCPVLITVALLYSLKSGSLIPPALFFPLKTALAIRGLLCLHTNFKIFCSSSVKMPLVI